MKPKKSLGQNFLISPRVAKRAVESAEISSGEFVVEVGPGKGMLTKELLLSGAKVLAIEKDKDMLPVLEGKFPNEIKGGQLKIICDDVRNFDIENYILKNEGYKVVANIPYYITGEILRDFLSAETKPSLIILLVQKEVAKRLVDKKESILSLSVKVYGNVSIICNVSSGNFYPIPKVDSALIKISGVKNPFENKETEGKFFKIVKSGFAHKRKLLISNLKNIFDKDIVEATFESLGINKTSRPEKVGLDVWKKLSEKL